MNYASLAILIVKHGIPTVLEIRRLLKDKNLNDEVTEEDWTKLETLSTKTYEDYVPPNRD